ncbi:MAG TPA: hypothetical protein VIJ06_02805 [Methylovirgula sp.]
MKPTDAKFIGEARPTQPVMEIERHIALNVFWLAALCAISIYLAVSYASIGRPLWIDEFLHFALGSMPSTAQAWHTIQARMHDIYVGQTGGYQILDYWLLKLFGASPLWLRMPSIVSVLFMSAATAIFFHVRGFKPHWAFLAILALFCQINLMYYGGEARPYMPLAAASVGVLAYYSVPHEARRRWWPLGFIAIAWGCLMHAYFSIYWCALAIFTYWEMQGFSLRRSTLKSFFHHCNFYLSAAGIAIYFGIGAATWMRSYPNFHLDPFFYTPRSYFFSAFFCDQFRVLVGYIGDPGLSILKWVCVSLPVVALILIRCPKWRVIWAPLALIGLALALTTLLVLVSYCSHYWILSRQWVASEALCAIGVIWLAAEMAKELGRFARQMEFACILALSILLVLRCIDARGQIALGRDIPHGPAPQAVLVDKTKLPTSNDGWVAWANANVASGGPVWPIFEKFFAK